MSYMKVSSRSKLVCRNTGRASEKKKKARRKPEWDCTVHDLSVHKASPDELNRRKVVSKSKNLDLVKAELMGKQIAKAYKKNKSPSYSQSTRSNALLREVLQDENDIADTLMKTDRMMAAVKDIFGDNPGKFRGLPNVTTAPEGTVPPDRKLPNGSSYSHPSKLDILSDSIMDQTALNDLDSSVDCGSDDEGADEGINYKTSVDMERFRRLLRKAETEEEKQRGRRQLSQSMAERALQKTLDLITKDTGDSWLARDDDDDDGDEKSRVSPLPNSQPDGAMNDTGIIKVATSCSDHRQVTSERVIASATTAADLKWLLEHLEKTMADYEAETGRHPVRASEQGKQENTLSSYTTCLVTSVTKLINYLRESEIKLKEERAVSEQLWRDLENVKALVNSLSMDLSHQREEFVKLQTEFFHFKNESEVQLHALKQALSANGIDIPAVCPLNRQAPYSDAANLPSNKRNDTGQVGSAMNGMAEHCVQSEQRHPMCAQRDRECCDVSVAMLLSPPKQTDSPRPNEGTHRLPGEKLNAETHQGMHNFVRRSSVADKAESQKNMAQSIQHQICQLEQEQKQQQQQLQQQQQQYHQQHHQQRYQQQQIGRPLLGQQNGGQTSLQQQQHLQHELAVQNSTSSQMYTESGHVMQQPQQQLQQQQQQQQRTQCGGQQIKEHIDDVSWPKTSCPEPVYLPQAKADNQSEADDEMLELQKQLEELNRKREMAQSKLQYIYKCHDVPTSSEHLATSQQASVPTRQATTSRCLAVSPAISPITVASENSVQPVQSAGNNKQPSCQVITVSLPRADGTIISPAVKPPDGSSTRVTSSKGQHVVSGHRAAMASGNRNPTSKAGTKAAWFALSSHIGTC